MKQVLQKVWEITMKLFAVRKVFFWGNCFQIPAEKVSKIFQKQGSAIGQMSVQAGLSFFWGGWLFFKDWVGVGGWVGLGFPARKGLWIDIFNTICIEV